MIIFLRKLQNSHFGQNPLLIAASLCLLSLPAFGIPVFSPQPEDIKTPEILSSFAFPFTDETPSRHPKLKEIVLISNQQKVRVGECESEEDLLCEEIPGCLQALRECVLLPFYNKPLSKEQLIEIKRAVIAYYRDYHRPVVTVDIPEQDITDGVLQLVVIEGRLDRICLSGNKWFCDDIFRNQIRLNTGDVIDSSILLQDIAWINRNPFHQAEVLFAPGEQEGCTDVEILVKDRLPIRFYLGGDNTGNRGTGEARWFAGFSWGNAFNCDHILNYQYTIGPSVHRFQSHSVDYLAPLPWRHVFELYGGYSLVHPHVSHFHSRGHSAQVSLRYHIPIGLLYKNYVHEIVFGADSKNMNNNLEFRDEAETPVFNSLVNITQAVFGYDFAYYSECQSITFNPQIYWSPGKIVSHQSEEDFNKMRPHAVNHYAYGTLALGDNITFCGGYVVSLLARFQGANETLLPSEQFGLGGYDTVRGYDEREVNVDNGFCGNFEVRSKPFCMVNRKDALILLAFADYGIGSNIHPLHGENKWHYLLGVGPGLRYQLDRYLSARLDVGYRVHKTQYGDDNGFKAHVGVIASY